MSDAGFGVGRVPQDVDQAKEAIEKLKAAELMARRTKLQPKPSRPYRTCRQCGQAGYEGAYPFSTLIGSSICDDCV